jgi:hypothetical protein
MIDTVDEAASCSTDVAEKIMNVMLSVSRIQAHKN